MWDISVASCFQPSTNALKLSNDMLFVFVSEKCKKQIKTGVNLNISVSCVHCTVHRLKLGLLVKSKFIVVYLRKRNVKNLTYRVYHIEMDETKGL